LLTWALLVAVLAALLAGVVTGTTGFGLALISTPLLLFVYEPRTVVFLTAVFSVFINTAVVWDSWHEVHRKLALALLLPACVGIVPPTSGLLWASWWCSRRCSWSAISVCQGPTHAGVLSWPATA
jgi:uncharacterized membrane protein YfcA